MFIEHMRNLTVATLRSLLGWRNIWIHWTYSTSKRAMEEKYTAGGMLKV
jgi:hypothetical protein